MYAAHRTGAELADARRANLAREVLTAAAPELDQVDHDTDDGPELAGVHHDAGAAAELAPRFVYNSRPSRARGLSALALRSPLSVDFAPRGHERAEGAMRAALGQENAA